MAYGLAKYNEDDLNLGLPTGRGVQMPTGAPGTPFSYQAGQALRAAAPAAASAIAGTRDLATMGPRYVANVGRNIGAGFRGTAPTEFEPFPSAGTQAPPVAPRGPAYASLEAPPVVPRGPAYAATGAPPVPGASPAAAAAPSKEMPRFTPAPGMSNADIRREANRLMTEAGTGQIAVEGLAPGRLNQILGEEFRGTLAAQQEARGYQPAQQPVQAAAPDDGYAGYPSTEKFFLEHFGRYTAPRTIEDYQMLAATEAAMRRGESLPQVDIAQARLYGEQAAAKPLETQSVVGLRAAQKEKTRAETEMAGFRPRTIERVPEGSVYPEKITSQYDVLQERRMTAARNAAAAAVAALPEKQRSQLDAYFTERYPQGDAPPETVMAMVERLQQGR